MKKKQITLLIILLFVVLYISYNHIKNVSVPDKFVDISIGVQNSTIVSPVFVAQARGIFKSNGLRVTIKKYPSGKLALSGMFNGEVDLATVADIPIVSKSFLRKDFKVIANFAENNDGAWIIARNDKGTKSPKDLIGKRIATQKNSAVHFFLDMFLLHNNIPEVKINQVFMKAVDLPGALARGEIDAFSMREPYANQAKVLLGRKIIEFRDPYIYNQTFNLVGMTTFLQQNTSTVKSFLEAIIEAEDYIHHNKDSSIGIVSNQLQQDYTKIQSIWDKIRFKVRLDQSLILTFEEVAKWFVDNEYNHLKEIPDYLDYIDTKPLKEIDTRRVNVF